MGKVPHFARFCWLRLLCDFLCLAFGDDVVDEVKVSREAFALLSFNRT